VVNSGAVITADSPNKYQWEIYIYYLCRLYSPKRKVEGPQRREFQRLAAL
jgi:hypothetical protein